MYKLLTKHGQLAAFAIGTIISLAFVAMVSGSDSDMSAVSDGSLNEPGLGLGLNASIGLTLICVAAIIAFGLYQVVTDLKGSKKGIIGVAVLALIFAIGYGVSSIGDLSEISSAPLLATVEKFKLDVSQFNKISGAIVTTLILTIIAAVAFIGSELLNFFK